MVELESFSKELEYASDARSSSFCLKKLFWLISGDDGVIFLATDVF